MSSESPRGRVMRLQEEAKQTEKQELTPEEKRQALLNNLPPKVEQTPEEVEEQTEKPVKEFQYDKVKDREIKTKGVRIYDLIPIKTEMQNLLPDWEIHMTQHTKHFYACNTKTKQMRKVEPDKFGNFQFVQKKTRAQQVIERVIKLGKTATEQVIAEPIKEVDEDLNSGEADVSSIQE